MDYDRLTKLLEGDDVVYAEIKTYHVAEDGSVKMKTTYIDYYGDNDYQWASSVKPILKR